MYRTYRTRCGDALLRTQAGERRALASAPAVQRGLPEETNELHPRSRQPGDRQTHRRPGPHRTQPGCQQHVRSLQQILREQLPGIMPFPISVCMQYVCNLCLLVLYIRCGVVRQDGTAAGLAAHRRFIRDFAVSWTNMITAGYTNSYNTTKAGKLGTLTAFNFTSQCLLPPTLIPTATPTNYTII